MYFSCYSLDTDADHCESCASDEMEGYPSAISHEFVTDDENGIEKHFISQCCGCQDDGKLERLAREKLAEINNT